MKNILVPTDFSKASHDAAVYAVSLAHQFGAKVHLLNAVIPPINIEASSIGYVMMTQDQIIRDNTKLMFEEIEALSKIHPVKMDSFVDQGYAIDLIRRKAEETKSELIIMGMKGKGKSNSVFGSTTTAVIRKMNLPVLTIPERATFSSINNITLASDYDYDTTPEKYMLLEDFLQKFNSKIRVVNVSVKQSEMTPTEALGRLKAGYAFSGYQSEFHTVSEETVEDGIEKFLAKYPTDLLVMLARSHSFFDRLFGKVHTKKMIYRTQKPLLVLHDK